jgi:hypothetical protein
MTTQSIFESGMAFGPYSDGHCFHIEKSATYLKVQQGVQMAEFLLIRLDNGKPSAVWVVEAKSSTPRPETQPNPRGGAVSEATRRCCFHVSFLNSITPYLNMILPPLEKGDRGGFFRWIAS